MAAHSPGEAAAPPHPLGAVPYGTAVPVRCSLRGGEPAWRSSMDFVTLRTPVQGREHDADLGAAVGLWEGACTREPAVPVPLLAVPGVICPAKPAESTVLPRCWLRHEPRSGPASAGDCWWRVPHVAASGKGIRYLVTVTASARAVLRRSLSFLNF